MEEMDLKRVVKVIRVDDLTVDPKTGNVEDIYV